MRARMAAGRIAVVMLAAGALTGCRDVGLDFNIPREEAENREFRYGTYDAGGEALLQFDNRNWMESAATEHIPDNVLRQVGTANGSAVYAPVWETGPFDRLYMRSGTGRFHAVTPVQ